MTHNQTWQQIRLICSSGLPPLTIMPILSDALHTLLPCLSFTFIYTDEQARPLSYYAENFNENSHEIFNQKGDLLTSHYDDPASFTTLFQLPAHYGNLINPPSQFYQSSTYLNLFKPNGLHNVIDMTVKHNHKPLALIGIFREKRLKTTHHKSGFSDKEIALLPLLYGHIKHLTLSSNSLESHAALVNSAQAKSLGLNKERVDKQQAVDSIDGSSGCEQSSATSSSLLAGCHAHFASSDTLSATITVNDKGDILFASSRAVDLLKEGLSVKNRYLLDYQNNLQPMVKVLCQSLQCKTTHSSKLPPVYYLPVPDGILMLRAYKMDALADSAGKPAYYTIHMEIQRPTRLKILYQLKRYELSPKTMTVGWLIATGLNNSQICDELAIQPSTLRSYLKNLYTRLNVNSHQQLKKKLTLN